MLDTLFLASLSIVSAIIFAVMLRDWRHMDRALKIVGICFLLAAALILFAAGLFDTADAAPVQDGPTTCYVYRVTLPRPTCIAGWCAAYADAQVNGFAVRKVWVTGRGLREGQQRLVPVGACR